MATKTDTRRTGLLSWVLIAVGVAAIGWTVFDYANSQAPAPLPESSFTVSVDEALELATPSEAPTPSPDRLEIPAVEARAPVDYFGVADGELLLPTADRVALYSDGARPGDPAGTVLVAGHVNSSAIGKGALYDLVDLQPGDSIWVSDARGMPVLYIVTGMDVLLKQALPQDIFTTDGEPRLVVVTCGGDIVDTPRGRAYESNVIVTAVPADPHLSAAD